jgi:hypothetical protein
MIHHSVDTAPQRMVLRTLDTLMRACSYDFSLCSSFSFYIWAPCICLFDIHTKNRNKNPRTNIYMYICIYIYMTARLSLFWVTSLRISRVRILDSYPDTTSLASCMSGPTTHGPFSRQWQNGVTKAVSKAASKTVSTCHPGREQDSSTRGLYLFCLS